MEFVNEAEQDPKRYYLVMVVSFFSCNFASPGWLMHISTRSQLGAEYFKLTNCLQTDGGYAER